MIISWVFHLTLKKTNYKQMKKLNLIFVCLLLCMQTVFAQKAKNVIFMIGDGMGLNIIQAALTVNGNQLTLTEFPVTGLQKTYSANDYTTDSGAAATAFACGVKTNNYSIGVDAEGNKHSSALKEAADAGFSTGIVVTCAITHATPAAFYAHVDSRSDEENIAIDFLSSNIDIAVGGGRKFFEQRKDGKNLTAELKTKGYQIVSSVEEMEKTQGNKLIAFVADKHPEQAKKGRNYLPKATELAIDKLKTNEKGFFLMVEGSQIDWACHANNKKAAIAEVLDFDAAVKVALDFAKKDGNTLVVVTADHETGGVAIKKGDYNKNTVDIKFTQKQHTGVPVVVFAYGPGAETFTGWYENTKLKSKILKAMGLK